MQMLAGLCLLFECSWLPRIFTPQEARCFPPCAITTLKPDQAAVVQEERKEAVKFCSWRSHDGLLYVLSFIFSSLRSVASPRRPVAGPGLPQPASANSRACSRRLGQWLLQVTESCSQLHHLHGLQPLEHTSALPFLPAR